MDSINGDNVNGDCVIGGGEEEQKEGKLRDFSKQFFPRRVKLTLEGVYGRGGYNRSGEPVPVYFTTSVEKGDFLRYCVTC